MNEFPKLSHIPPGWESKATGNVKMNKETDEPHSLGLQEVRQEN